MIYAAYVVLFAASLFGNSVIIHIIRTDNSMKTSTYYLILNQACADLYRTLMESLHISCYLIGGRWIGGIVGLTLASYFWQTCLFRPSLQFGFTQPLLLIAFTLLVDLSAPRLYLSFSKDNPNIVELFRSLFDRSLHYRKLAQNQTRLFLLCNSFSTRADNMTVSLNVFLPFIITAVLYVIVCHKLRSREVPGEGANQNQRQAEAMKTARKGTRMMITVVVL